MKKTRVLAEMGSSCCLLVPLVGYAASAAEPPALSNSQLSAELPYPVVGLNDQQKVSQSLEEKPGLIESVDTLNLHAYDAQLPLSVESRWQPASVDTDDQSLPVAHYPPTVDHMPPVTEQFSPESLLESPYVVPSVSEIDNIENGHALSQPPESLSGLGTLFVELRSGENAAGIPTLVKGREDGQQAVSLDQWLLPFEDVLKAFELTASVQADGQIALSSPDIVTTVELASLPDDPELGLMWSIADIYQHIGASAEFDRERYVIQFNRTAVNQSASGSAMGNHYESIEALLAEHALPQSSESQPIQMPEAQSTGNTVLEVLPETPTDELPSSESQASVLQVADSTGVATREDALAVDSRLTTSRIESTADVSLGLFLVGLSIDDMTTVEATLVRGREDGLSAVAFDQWLIPFDDAIAAVGATVSRQADGQLFIRAPGVARIVDPASLKRDPDLGIVFSIADLSEILELDAEFSFSEYAINFRPPLSNPRSPEPDLYPRDEPPIVTAGLPVVAPSTGFNLGGVRQSTSVAGSFSGGVNSPVGQLSAVGSLGGGSWYARLNQPDLVDASTWQLSELQYVHQSDEMDYALGTQPTFWPSQNTRSDYWGATLIQRWGFTPPNVDGQSGFDPRRQMQASQVERSASGEAEPGTLVQLTESITGRVVAETLVDSSGLYRFDNIPANGSLRQTYTSQGYVVKLYADGLLTNEPDVRSASFTTFPGHLPQGAAALVSSAGLGRRRDNGQLVGEFDSFRGGVAYRYGVSDALSLGGGVVLDDNLHALVEAFYLPANTPLRAAISALIDLETGVPQVIANARYEPTDNLAIQFDSNRFSQRLAAEWKVEPGLTLTASGNTRDETLSVGANASYRSGPWSGSAAVSIDTRQQMRWSLYAGNDNLRLTHRGNELSTHTALTYRIPSPETDLSLPGFGHELSLSYDTVQRGLSLSATPGFSTASSLGNLGSGSLALMEWRYRSPERDISGQSLWTTSLGYGIGSQGTGPVASVTANLGRGFELQARYQGVSAFDDEDSFRISLVSRLGNRDGLGWGHVREDRLRSQGGLLVQPFFDTNANGQLDDDEPLYLENPELLVSVNNRPITTYESDVNADGLLLTTDPGTYRVEIDLAGLPIDRTADIAAYAADIVPGQFTAVPIPLLLSYTVSGVVVDAEGNPVAGTRVEAVSDSGHSQISITNGAGVYYLERLKPELYDLMVDGLLQDALSLEDETEAFQNREIRLL